MAFELDGWRVNKLSESLGDFIHTWNWSQSLPTGAEGNLVLFMPEQEISELANWYANNEEVSESTEPEATAVAGNNAYRLDILVKPTDDLDPFRACFGLRLVDDGPWFQNINACTWTRVWVVNVDGFAVTVYVTASYEDLRQNGNLDPDNVWQIEDFQPLLDDFINGLTFCTAATPCDD